jgi:hypothetical protein
MTTNHLPAAIWDAELTALKEPPADWLWHGILARSNVTLLTSQWKAGKTTLLSLLLARRKQGGTLAGLAVQPGKTLVVTEEAPALWADRARRLDFGGQVCFLSRPFSHIPDQREWQALVDRIGELSDQHGIDLVAFDPLAPYLRNENTPRGIYETLLPLTALTRRGLATLLCHHPGKGARPIGQAARGSGALPGHADIVIEMRHPGGNPFTRKRRFLGLSRFAETPRRLLLELDAEGNDYLPVPEDKNDPTGRQWETLLLVLEDAPQKLTRQDILAEWPPDFLRPERVTLWRWLDRAVANNQILCEGSGRKADPFRYWLPQREEVWKQDPWYQEFERQRLELKLPFQSLQQKKEAMRGGR